MEFATRYVLLCGIVKKVGRDGREIFSVEYWSGWLRRRLKALGRALIRISVCVRCEKPP